MAPVIPWSATPHSLRISSRLVMPPEAITGMVMASARRSLASMFTPESLAARPMAVETVASSPRPRVSPRGPPAANPAAPPHRHLRVSAGDRLDHRAIHRFAGERTVQVDNVDTARTFLDPASGHGDRVTGKYRVVFPS